MYIGSVNPESLGTAGSENHIGFSVSDWVLCVPPIAGFIPVIYPKNQCLHLLRKEKLLLFSKPASTQNLRLLYFPGSITVILIYYCFSKILYQFFARRSGQIRFLCRFQGIRILRLHSASLHSAQDDRYKDGASSLSSRHCSKNQIGRFQPACMWNRVEQTGEHPFVDDLLFSYFFVSS